MHPTTSQSDDTGSQAHRLTGSQALTAADVFESVGELPTLGGRSLFNRDSKEQIWARVPYFAIALLLTATAIAKLWMLLTDPFADVRVGLPREILWLSVAFEFWLAFENFRLRDHRVMAFVNSVVFASFAIVASIRLAMGYGSCGCSGSLELPTWFFIVIDVGVVAWFTGSEAARTQVASGIVHLSQIWSFWSSEKRGRFVGLVFFAVIVVAIQLPFAAAFRAVLMGEQPFQAIVRFDGDLKIGEAWTGLVEIHNRSFESAKVVGASRSCRCFDLADDPVSTKIPANSFISLPLVIKPNRLGPINQRVVLFLDHPKQFRLNIDVFSTVKKEK